LENSGNTFPYTNSPKTTRHKENQQLPAFTIAATVNVAQLRSVGLSSCCPIKSLIGPGQLTNLGVTPFDRTHVSAPTAPATAFTRPSFVGPTKQGK
jgi:hypothetical protein